MPIPSQIVRCYKYIDSKQKEFIEELRHMVAMQNISSNPVARSSIDSAIKWLQARLVRRGFKVQMKDVGSYLLDDQLSEKKIPTVILAALGNDKHKKCLLYYCHLDVFEVRSSKWETDPFILTEKAGKLYGRGTAKMKGPLLSFLHAIDTYQALEMDLPVNIKIICESMNECKSVGIPKMLEGLHTGFLTNIDCILITDGQWTGPLYASILHAFRGVCYFNLTIEGLAENLHSGEYGGVVQEPLQDLLFILNHLVNSSGKLTIPGLDEDMTQLTPDEEKIYSQLKVIMEEYRQDSGVRELSHNANCSQTLMHAWRYPCFNLHYIKTLPPCRCPEKLSIPKNVRARFSIRIVPHQTPEKVCRLICNHLNTVLNQRNSSNKVRLQMEDSSRPWIEDHKHWNYEAAKIATQQVYKDQANLVRDGKAYPPVLDLQAIMPKTNILLLPLVDSGSNIHKEKENISLRCYIEGTKLLTSYFYYLGVA